MKELTIVENMIAIARGRKHGSHIAKVKSAAQKRSTMLKMIMPFLSRETGEKLAIAIEQRSTAKFASIWDQIKREVVNKLEHSHKATASSCLKIEIPNDMLLCILEKVCKRLCENKDPCPLEPIDCVPKTYEAINPIQAEYPNIYDLYSKMVAKSTK